MPRITVTLDKTEREALVQLAERERRDPRAQAALIIRRALARRKRATPARPPANVGDELPDWLRDIPSAPANPLQPFQPLQPPEGGEELPDWLKEFGEGGHNGK